MFLPSLWSRCKWFPIPRDCLRAVPAKRHVKTHAPLGSASAWNIYPPKVFLQKSVQQKGQLTRKVVLAGAVHQPMAGGRKIPPKHQGPSDNGHPLKRPTPPERGRTSARPRDFIEETWRLQRVAILGPPERLEYGPPKSWQKRALLGDRGCIDSGLFFRGWVVA